MNKLSIVIAIFVLLPLFLGAAGMVTIIAAKFSQTTINQTPSETVNPPTPIINTTCGDGICTKNERENSSCSVDC